MSNVITIDNHITIDNIIDSDIIKTNKQINILLNIHILQYRK